MYGGNRRKDDLAKAHLILSTQAEKQGSEGKHQLHKEKKKEETSNSHVPACIMPTGPTPNSSL
jgi:hypothetical protein